MSVNTLDAEITFPTSLNSYEVKPLIHQLLFFNIEHFDLKLNNNNKH